MVPRLFYLMDLILRGCQTPSVLLVLSLEAGEHQGQERLLTQQGHALRGKHRQLVKSF